MALKDVIAIRKKVAKLCGYIDIYFKNGILADACLGSKDGISYILLPHYEESIDAIAKAFNDHGLTYTLQKGINMVTGETGYIASSSKGGDRFSSKAAIAMCYLFIHSMEQK